VSHPPVPSLLQDLRAVEGWLSDEDVVLFFAADDATRELGIHGDLLEIGAYKGKSAVVLGYCLAEGEELVVVDPFGRPAGAATVLAEQNRHYGDLTRAAFDANYARFHRRPPRVIEDFSTDVPVDALPSGARLVHVDGAHDFTSVVHDIDLVLGQLAEGGVVAFDDALNAGAPGVAAAVWGAVRDGSAVPLMTSGKLWLCHPAWHARLSAEVGRRLASSPLVELIEETIGTTTSFKVKPRVQSAPRSRAREVAVLVTPPIVPRGWRRLKARAKPGPAPTSPPAG
jgi:hypothetical protein